MKAVLIFNLPEEQSEHDTAVNGWKYKSVIWDMDNFLRNEIKHNNKDYEEVRNKLHELLNENNVTLND